MIAKGTIVTVRTTNGGEITLPLARDYRPTFCVVLDNGTRDGLLIYMMRITSVEPEAGCG